MFRIGEFSKLTQVSIRMLRYYDENGLLIPASIHSNGYRYYKSEQIEQLNRILFLREVGLQVSEIKQLLDTWQEETIYQELRKKELESKQTILKEKERLVRIRAALSDMKQDKLRININIVIKSLPEYQVISLRKTVPDYYQEGLLWKELSEFFIHKKIELAKQTETFTIYHDNGGNEDMEIDMELCIVSDLIIEPNNENINSRQLEAVERAACFLVYGPYENIAPAYQEFAFWLDEHPQYKMMGQSRQICHRGPWNTNDANDYVTELQIPILIST